MDFQPTAEQAMLRQSLQRYLGDNHDFSTRNRLAADDGGLSRNLWRDFAELGWLAAGLPEAHGGWGGGPVETAVIMEELGRHLVREPYLETAAMAARILLGSPNSELSASTLAAIAAGDAVVVCAFPESAYHSARAPCRTKATARPGGGFILSGRKIHVPWGAHADQLLVSAHMASAGANETSAAIFLVPSDAEGATRKGYETIDGRQAAEIEFTEVALPASALVADHDLGPDLMAEAEDHAIVALCAESVGCMEAVIALTTDYLNERRQFGRRLAEFQVLQHRMAEMFIEADFARSMTYMALGALTLPPEERARAVSAAKVRVDAAGRFVAGNAVHNHGGIGITEEYPVGHYLRRLMAIAMSAGGTPHHLARFVQSSGEVADCRIVA